MSLTRRTFLKILGLAAFAANAWNVDRVPKAEHGTIKEVASRRGIEFSKIRIYSGVPPMYADEAATGNLLMEVPYPVSEDMSVPVLATGVATYYRIVQEDDDNKFSTTAFRIQGTIT